MASSSVDLHGADTDVTWLREEGRSVSPPSPPAGRSVNRAGPLLIPQVEVLPGGRRAFDGISLRAFCLGLVLGISITTTGALVSYGSRIWRASAFVAALSLFHFLEFYVTAAYNTQGATISAYLLSSNGKAYNAAHTAALLECIVSTFMLPEKWRSISDSAAVVAVGLCLIVGGQCIRSMAMAQAGTNFNHFVQTTKADGHELVTHGIYAYLRHPSYFGFFWWGLGTQLMLGNVICFIVYAVVLWNFFNQRINKEEEHLVDFFEQDYENYRRRVGTGIPLIR